ncbi:SUN domain protein (Adg3) [Diplocarpon rosae]|nr:SUN domain protein (Adg3) [Diplocarpon rosae]
MVSHNPQTPNSSAPASKLRASSSIDDLQYETNQRIKALETSDDARSLRLSHHDSVLEQVSKKAGEMKQQITRPTSLDQQRACQIGALENKINESSYAGSTAEIVDHDEQKARIDEIQQKVDLTTQVTVDAAVLLKQNNKDIEQFESKHSLHELSIAKLEKARVEHSDSINDLGAKYNDLNDAVFLLEQRSGNVSEPFLDSDVIESHITSLKKAHGDILLAHDTMLQNHVILNDRLNVVEQRDNALAAQLYDTAVLESRMSDIELSGSHALSGVEVLQNDHLGLRSRLVRVEERDQTLKRAEEAITNLMSRTMALEAIKRQAPAADPIPDQGKIDDRLEVVKKQRYRQLSRMDTGQDPGASLAESVETLREQCSAQAQHIESLIKKANKSSDWVKYLTAVTNTQKDLIENLHLKLEEQQVSETKFKLDVESRIEQLINGNQKREDAMMERIRALEKKADATLTGPCAQSKSVGSSVRSEGMGNRPARKIPRKF